MKKSLHLLVILAIFSVSFFHGGLVAWAATPLKVVVVSGSNYEMGVQYGEQAAELIAANRDVTWNLLDNQVTAYPGGPALGHDVILKDIQVWTYYLERYDPKLKEWLLGIVKGCKNRGLHVSYVDLVALMVLPQEMWARPSWPYPAETQVTAYTPSKRSVFSASGRTNTQAMASCTSFAATGTATPGGVPMVSLTLGFISEITQYVVLVAFPDEGERFINLTLAGKVTNNTGMNDKYAWIMTAAVTDPTKECSSNWGVPSEAYHHYLQQYTKSPQEAMDFIGETPRGGVTGVFLFADKSGDVLAYECSHCTCVMRKPHDLGENKASLPVLTTTTALSWHLTQFPRTGSQTPTYGTTPFSMNCLRLRQGRSAQGLPKPRGYRTAGIIPLPVPGTLFRSPTIPTIPTSATF